VPVTPPAGAACPSRGDLLRDFARLFIWLMTMVILGYAGVFSGLQALVPGGAFRGLDGSWAPLQFLYFSVVTIATVGYGDILPASTAARLITASEVLAGLSLLVFLMTAFTMTMEPDHPPA